MFAGTTLRKDELVAPPEDAPRAVSMLARVQQSSLISPFQKNLSGSFTASNRHPVPSSMRVLAVSFAQPKEFQIIRDPLHRSATCSRQEDPNLSSASMTGNRRTRVRNTQSREVNLPIV